MTKSNVLVQGEIGTGKSRSIITLLPEWTDELGARRRGVGHAVYLASLEAGSTASLGPNACTGDAKAPVVHHHYIKPLALTWTDFRKFATLLNDMPVENVIKINDPNRRHCRQLLDLIDTGGAFVCDGCGHEFGDASEWGTDVSYVNDSLTGITTVARLRASGEWPP